MNKLLSKLTQSQSFLQGWEHLSWYRGWPYPPDVNVVSTRGSSEALWQGWVPKSSRAPSGFEPASSQIQAQCFNSLNHSPHINRGSNLSAVRLGLSKNESVGLKTSIFFCEHFFYFVKHPTNKNYPEAVIRMCYVEKVFLKISQNSQKNTCARVSFLIKLQASSLQLY